MNYSLYNLDYLKFLSEIKDNSIDLIITDPPYSSLERHRKIGTTVRLKDNWFKTIPNESFPQLFKEFYRILKNNSHLYVMSDSETMFVIKPMGEQSGFKFWRPLVIDHKSISMGYHYRGRVSYVLFFEKGKKKLNDLGISDLLEGKRVRGKYATEKNVSISETLVVQSSSKYDIVLDPFMGSGSTGEACLKHNRFFIGNDLSAKAFSLSEDRLKKFESVGGETDILK